MFAGEARRSGDTLLNSGRTGSSVRPVLKLRREEPAETETEVGDAGCWRWWVNRTVDR